VHDTLRKWARALGFSPAAALVRADDGVRIEAFGLGEPDREFVAYTIAGLGRHWPVRRGQLKKRIAGSPSSRLASQ
jgi:hypothetical protein